MTAFWGIAVVVFLVVEGVTFGLTSLWFALGAIAALISAVLGAPEWLQAAWFIIISGVTLALTRPLARKYVNGRRQATNADRVVGTSAMVAETIDNVAAAGSVMAGGKHWTARSADGDVIEKGELVTVLKIDGVKLIVQRTQNPSEPLAPGAAEANKINQETGEETPSCRS